MADRTYLPKKRKFLRSETRILAVILLIAITSKLQVQSLACTSHLELQSLPDNLAQPDLGTPVVIRLFPSEQSHSQTALLQDCDDKFGCPDPGDPDPGNGLRELHPSVPDLRSDQCSSSIQAY